MSVIRSLTALVILMGPASTPAGQKGPNPGGVRPARYMAEAGPPRGRAAEARRDYAVLEAALDDLADPRNPEHRHHVRNVGYGREVVVHGRLEPEDLRIGAESLDIDNGDPRKIPAGVLSDFYRRNRVRSLSLADFRPANPNVLVRDLDGLFGRDPFGFERRYTKAWGYVRPHLPGYSKDGDSAFVIFDGGPNGMHGLNWYYMLGWEGGRWVVRWRPLHPHE
jgi:hypothetical protein